MSVHLSGNDEQQERDEGDDTDPGPGGDPGHQQRGGQRQGPGQDDEEQPHPQPQHAGALLLVLHHSNSVKAPVREGCVTVHWPPGLIEHSWTIIWHNKYYHLSLREPVRKKKCGPPPPKCGIFHTFFFYGFPYYV